MSHRRCVRMHLCALILALATGTAGCNSSGNGAAAAADVAYGRVMNSNTLRVAYISYPPSFVKDANTGKYSGPMYDALQDIARRMDLKVEYVEETGWGTMIEAVRSGRVDLVCTGLWPNATRGKLVDFTDAVYFSPIQAYVRAGNHEFDGNLEAINDAAVSIATIDGEMTSIIAAADFPHAKADAHPQSTDIAQMLMEIGTGKARVTFVEPAVANGFLKANPGMVEPVARVNAVRVFPNVFMVAKGEGKLLSMLNTALSEAANTGAIDRIVRQYEVVPGLFYRRQLPFRSNP
jgi:polar amino acid transport system substrate-binding protein